MHTAKMILAMIVGIAGSSIAFAQTPTPQAQGFNQSQMEDAACFRIGFSSAAKAQTNANQTLASNHAMMAMYYLGRITQSGAQLDSLFIAINKSGSSMTAETVRSKGEVCITRWKSDATRSLEAMRKVAAANGNSQ